MVKFTILAGGFSQFIARYIFDSDASSLTLVPQTTKADNPSWIASHPQNRSILYAVNEVATGSLQSFLVGLDGGLTLVDTVPSGGSQPTFTGILSTGEVSAINFGSPNSTFVATIPGDPLHFQRNSSTVEFPVGDGPSNPHMSLEFNGEVFIPDLGGDKIWRLVRDGAPGKFRVQGQINVEAGSGPRHIAIRDNILFTLNELTSTLTAQLIPPAPNGTALPLLANVSVTHPTTINPTFRAAEILISTPSERFPNPLIYVSNRNLGPELDARGDTIAIFEFKNGTNSSPIVCPAGSVKRRIKRRGNIIQRQAAAGPTLELVAQVFTGLTQIRSMSLGPVIDGGDEFLVAGANVNGGVVIFRRVDGGRNLTEIARNQEIEARTSFVFV
ncbi:Uncharacterized protein C18E5.01 [Hypsizygus marmoreus]|uniref:Uncharacterized protein C18E5.01 n=1 Tax=Hypsizygus marmoreus TaxID=39966 RepID=A0A369JZF8_HYPMA|nr:Uncharacterized protein C18E5.01 [Hypsizygus marmoreus]